MAMWTRRELIKAVGAASAAAAVLPANATATVGPEDRWDVFPEAHRALRILFIGGTGFIGPHMVRRAQARGHSVTLFNRGRTNPHLFPDVEKLVGDRDGGLDVLRGGSWDAVIDTSGYIPRVVRDSAELLRETVHRYLFISTGDVYADFEKIGLDEDYTLDTMEDPTIEDPGRFYGPLKVLCERAVLETYPDRCTILRPGWIIGAGDYNSISPYWPMRIHHGGTVLAPGDPTDPVQIIDPHDLAAFVIKILEEDINGIYNTVGPASPLTMAELLYGIRAVTDSSVDFTWVPADFLRSMDVAAMTDLPIWFPPLDDYPTPAPFEPGAKGFHQMSGARAIAAGLSFRPLAETARDVIDEYLSRDEDWSSTPRRFGLSLDREAEVLAAWRASGR
jgi:2'-hydroxyisoflavone reductase